MSNIEKLFFDITGEPTYGALFAGIGGFCSGFDDENFIGRWASDLCNDCESAYKFNYPETDFILSDIRALKGHQLTPVTVLHGGFPCQSFSQAGNRMGFDDERGQLFFEIVRLLKEWGDSRPPVVLLENSPYILIGNNGDWFEIIKSEFQKLGYWFSDENCVELSTDVHGGSPQRRKRVFMCALDSKKFDYNPFTRYLFNKKPKNSLQKIINFDTNPGEEYFLDDDNKYSEMISAHFTDDPYRIYQLRKHVVRVQRKDECPTLTANMGGGGHNVPFIAHDGRVRKLTERECLDLQGFSQKFEFPLGLSMGARYRMIGNSVSPAIARELAKAIRKIIEEVV